MRFSRKRSFYIEKVKWNNHQLRKDSYIHFTTKISKEDLYI